MSGAPRSVAALLQSAWAVVRPGSEQAPTRMEMRRRHDQRPATAQTSRADGGEASFLILRSRQKRLGEDQCARGAPGWMNDYLSPDSPCK